MAYLLNVVYLLLLASLSPWLLLSSLRKGKYREGLAQKFLGLVPRRRDERPCLWLHAVSVGEVNLLATLLSRLERQFPDWEIVISTTTKTGYALAKSKYAPRTVFYAPLDFSWAVKTALRRIRPRVIVLAELELWPNLIRQAHRRGVKLAVVNGRLSRRSLQGYRRIRPLVASMLRCVDLLAVQNKEYARGFWELGAQTDAVQVTGSLKFDGAETRRDNPKTRMLADLAGITSEHTVFLAGSTQAPEEEVAIQVYQELASRFPPLRLILVPRHPERFEEVAQLLEDSGLPWIRRSQLDSLNRDFRPDPRGHRVVLVDAVGELGSWWGLADIAFVGGSLGNRGGQNMIEPAAYGAAVSFGPNTRNFKEIVGMLLDCKAAVVVSSDQDLKSFVNRCLVEPDFAQELGTAARRLVCENQGAADKTAALISALLNATSAGRRAA